MKKVIFLYIILSTSFLTSITGQLECEIVDPLADINAIIENYSDPCCGYDFPDLVCYTIPGSRVLSSEGYCLTYIELACHTYDNINYSLDPDIPLIDALISALNLFANSSSCKDVVEFYKKDDNTFCTTYGEENVIDFGNIVLKNCTSGNNEMVLTPEITEINCPFENLGFDFNMDEFLNLPEDYQATNMTIFQSSSGSIDTKDFTSAANFIVDEDQPLVGAPTAGEVGYLLNYAATNGLINFNSGCFNLNCVSLGDIVDQTFGNPDPEISQAYWDQLNNNTEIQDEIEDQNVTTEEFVAELESQLDAINLIDSLNKHLGLDILGIPCDDDLEYDFPFNIPDNTEQKKSSASGPTVKTEADLSYFSKEIPGLGHVPTKSPTSAMPKENVSGGVDLFNGAQNSKIDLYNFVSRDIQVPIALQSSNNGLKVNDLGSETGQHWNLSAGGEVHRLVRGLPDEFKGVIESETYGKIKKLGFRAEMPSSMGVDISIEGVSNIPKSPGQKIRDGIGATIILTRVDWSPLQPGLIHFSILIPIQINIFGVQVTITLSPGFSLGLAANEEYGPIRLVEESLGYQQLKSGSYDIPVIDDIGNFDALPEEIQNEIFPYLSGTSEFDDNVKLFDLFSSFKDLKEIFTGAEYTSKRIDYQPDEYQFNVGGYSGKFYIDQDENIIISPYIPELSIVADMHPTEKTVLGFTFCLPNGHHYSCGFQNDALEWQSGKRYYLPNFYTYPGLSNDRDKFGQAEIDQQILTIYPPLGPTINIPHTATYERNYRISNSPSHINGWMLSKIKSLITQEEVLLSYEKEIQEYNESKSIEHSFPYTNPHLITGFVTDPNPELNPFEARSYYPKWENGRMAFNFMISASKQSKSKLQRIIGQRGEHVAFTYDTPRGEIINTSLLDSILVIRGNTNDNLFKGWKLEYNVSTSPDVSIHCEGESYTSPEAPITVSHENSYSLGQMYEHPIYGSNFFFRVNPSIQGFNIPFQIPLPYDPIRPIDIEPFRTQYNETGSLLEIKYLSSEFLDYTDDEQTKDEAIFKAEFSKSFLVGIKEIDKTYQEHTFLDIDYYGELSSVERRFSIHQNELGYAVNNSFSGSPLPKTLIDLYYPGDGSHSRFPHFPMKNNAYPNGIFNYGISKVPTLNFVQNGAIKELTLNTGLKHRYAYELGLFNVYSDVSSDPGSGNGTLDPSNFLSGLLVSSFTKEIPESPDLVQHYNYSKPSFLGIPLPNIFSRDHHFYYRTKDGDQLEYRLTTSTQPFSHIPLLKSNIVGFGLVNKSTKGQGSVDHYFITSRNPIQEGSTNFLLLSNTPSSRDKSLSVETKKLFYSENDGIPCLLCSKITSGTLGDAYGESGIYPGAHGIKDLFYYSERFNSSMIGLEYKSMVKNENGEAVKKTENIYQEISAPESFDLFDYHKVEHFYQGTFWENYLEGKIAQFVPLPKLSSDLINILVQMIFLNGNYETNKYIERKHFFSNNHLTPSNTILKSSSSTTNFLASGTSNSENQHFWYDVDYNLSVPTKILNKHGDASTTEENYFVHNNFSHKDKFDEDVLDFYELPETNYRMPLANSVKSKTSSSAPLTLIKYSTSPKTKLDNGIIALKSSYINRNGGHHLHSIVDEYDDNGLPVSYRLAKHGAKEWSNSDWFFDSIQLTFTPQLQVSTRSYAEQTTSYDHDPDFFVLNSETNSDGILTSYSYDDRWRLSESISLNGRQRTEYMYGLGADNNWVNSKTLFTDESKPPQEMTVYYDGLGKTLKELRVNDGAVINDYTYDGLGRVISNTNITSGTTSIKHENCQISHATETIDAVGNVTKEIQGGTSNGFYSHNSLIDANGSQTKSYTDGLGLHRLTVDALGGETSYTYDDLHRLTTITNPIGQDYEYSYNKIDKPYKVKIPNKGETEIWWDYSFRPIMSVDANDNIIVSKYDDYNRVVAQGLFNAIPQEIITGSNAVVKYELSENLINENNIVLENIYDGTNKEFSWLASSRERIFGANGMTLDFKESTYSNDDIGRALTSDTSYPFGEVNSINSYNDANLLEELSTDYIPDGGLPEYLAYVFEHDDILRPGVSPFLRTGLV